MPMKLKELESVLKSMPPFTSTDYKDEFKRLKHIEYVDTVPKRLGVPKVSEDKFSYKRALETEGCYSILNGRVVVRTLGSIQLPVNESTTTQGVKIATKAPVPCDCWVPVRERIAKEHGGWVELEYRNPVYECGKRLTRGGTDISVVGKTISELENVKPGVEEVKQMRLELNEKIGLYTNWLENL